jgi:Fur family transcriptional regulator, ferric uptake regulator
MKLNRHFSKIGHFSKIDREDLSTTQFKQVIRTLGLKVTQQRLKILEIIMKGRDHVTAQEVFEAVSKIAPEIGFATVYRFLKTLAENGFVTEVRMRGLPARYEWAGKEHHDHLSCTECGKICEFESEEIERLQDKIAETFGFELTDHILELYGLCTDCQMKVSPQKRFETPKLSTDPQLAVGARLIE